MKKSVKLSVILLGFCLALASLIFAACGKLDYSKMHLSSSRGAYVEVFANEEKELTITIENPVDDMNRGLTFTNSNPRVASVTQIANRNLMTTYMIKGLSGGDTTLEFTSIEGLKSCSVLVRVKEYSDKLLAGDNSLYVSSNKKELAPSNADFVLTQSATERDLDFYFYGINNVKGSLTLEDVTSGGELQNKFVSVSHYQLEDKNYLIFADEEGGLHTLGASTLVAGTDNVKYSFIDVTQDGENYTFNEAIASSITPGQKLTFLARYVNEPVNPEGEPIILSCERDFYLLTDIDPTGFSHEYGYKIEDVEYNSDDENTSYKIDELKNGNLILIPNYVASIKNNPFLAGERANYLTAYLEVKMPTNSLLQYNFNTKDSSVATSKLIKTTVLNSLTTYYIEINCAKGAKAQTTFDLNFYYKGFENSTDENVNFTYSLPIEIRIIPTNLLINNVDFNKEHKVYKFYNSYASDDAGWQAFNFTVIPEGAEYDNLEIDLTNSKLQIKYQNKLYSNCKVNINNLRDTVFVKGLEDAAITAEPALLPVQMDFSVIQNDTYRTNIKYEIVNGASQLNYENEAFKEGIYVERYSGQQDFSNIYSDAQFSDVAFDLESGKDVVEFILSEQIYTKEGDNYYLNLKINPTDLGSGTYTLTLDNGVKTTITVFVRETLNTLSIKTTDEDNSIKMKEDSEEQSLIYLLNKNGESYFDIELIANGNQSSQSIIDKDVFISSNYITVESTQDGRYIFHSPLNGSETITFEADGYEIRDFSCERITKQYVINLVTYDLAKSLNVYKVKDGYSENYPSSTSASYINVYSNTYFDNLRQAQLDVSIENRDAYLFQNPADGEYVESGFDSQFLYFESDTVIIKNSQYVDKIYYSPTQSNIYTLGDFGTFDSERLIFTAFDNLPNSARIKLIAHVMQYGKAYSFTINIGIDLYNEVSSITLQRPLNEIEFSSLKPSHSVIAYPTNSNATNPDIVAIFNGGEISEGSKKYVLLDSSSVSYIESNNQTYISFTVSDEYISFAESYTGPQKMSCEILIVASDWFDNSGNLRSGYNEKAIRIKANFANGEINNRFTIDDASDLLKIKNNLSAHYQIKSTIDASSILNELPLGEFKGSLIGTSEIAAITGLRLSNVQEVDENAYCGLFTTIAEGAFIEYVKFDGALNLTLDDRTSYVGLIAGINNGQLINIGATLAASKVEIAVNANCYIGGIVGENNGSIIQDLTMFDNKDAWENELGRKDYQGFSPNITLYMNDFLTINYDFSASRLVGGICGHNNGTIQKIDSSTEYSGMLNHMAFTRIKTNPTAEINSSTNFNMEVGALAGRAVSDTSFIQGGFINDLGGFAPYNSFNNLEDPSYGTFEAGKGLLVGGEIWGQGYVGGVVGRIRTLNDSFKGITSRTFVRAEQKGASLTSVHMALIANVENVGSTSYRSSFALQAIDDGRINEESAMGVLYATQVPPSLESPGTSESGKYNIIGFGNQAIQSLMNGGVENVLTYVKRHYISDEQIISNPSKSYYYGDFVVVGNDAGRKKVLYRQQFKSGSSVDLNIAAKFNNKMDSLGINEMFYAYYFEVGSLAASNLDITEIQSTLNERLNTLSSTSAFYPFIANGEMLFTSRTTDVIYIDFSGKMTIKKAGVALISATSILNSNNSLNFYINVVNYFNSQQTDGLQKDSIVYATERASSVPIDTTTIELRGNNSATLYVIPRYDIHDESANLISSTKGEALLDGVAFYLAGNREVSAVVSVKNSVGEDSDDLNITITGQSIIIKRKDNTPQDVYSLTITPSLTKIVNDIEYRKAVNKELDNVKVDYKYGALEIGNKNFNDVPIYTGKEIAEKIYIITTDENESTPKYYIRGLKNQFLQGDLDNIEYQTSGNDNLFNISIQPDSTCEDLLNGTFKCSYDLKISINVNSPLYKQRYNQEIYGKYYLYVQASSNSSKMVIIEIDFDKTDVSSIVIDNYISYADINKDKVLTSTAEYTNPGQSGLLAITINPSDSDFDYIVVENDEQNYLNGHSSAVFSFAVRKNDDDEEEVLFDDSIIKGASVPNGIKITLEELVNVCSQSGNVAYNGIVYVKYNFASSNVIDSSRSKINISIYKDEQKVFGTSKDLTIKIQNFVSVGIAGKDPISTNQNGFVKNYEVARGLKYKLDVESYGFRQDNIVISTDKPSLAKITKENDGYYLTITEGNISYENNDNFVTITASASQQDGDKLRTAQSKTGITIYEYVMLYKESDHNSDIISGMGKGVVNVQVGSQITFSVDIDNFLEYNANIVDVVNKINDFVEGLANNGDFSVYTNLISDSQPDYKMAAEPDEFNSDERKLYKLNPRDAFVNYYFNANGLSITPMKTHQPEEKFYYFIYKGYYKAQNGVYSAQAASEGNKEITTRFVLNVYSTSSKESPIPIYNYDDLAKMQNGGYYILLNDITLPATSSEQEAAFTSLNGDIASLDGNGHAINFAGTYDMGDSEDIGLFSHLSSETIVKNLIVNYTASGEGDDVVVDENDNAIYGLNGLNTVRFVTTADNFTFGTITAQNSGIITNCQVYCDDVNGSEYYLSIKANNALTANNNAGGLVGYNHGYITNCGVSINVKMPFNFAGLVAQNTGKIAASYFTEGKIENNSNYDQHIAGLVLANTESGQIITSYVSGKTTNDSLYSKDKNSYLKSTFASGGFVYNNAGLIKDCYTDIYLGSTSSDMAGFVYRNGGVVRNSFSLSILRSGTTASAGFARDNSYMGVVGKFENCYYFYNQRSLGLGVDEDINVSLYDVTYEGIEKLNKAQFGEIDKYFANYSYDTNVGTKAVWFFSKGALSNEFIDFVPTTSKVVISVENGNTQSNTVYDTKLMELGQNRLNLVAPNTRVLSIRNFERSEVDETTGNTTYFYRDDNNVPDKGTIHNPRLVQDCFDMENEILNQTSLSNINTTNYRIVSDINYSDFEGHSSLYKVIFAGNMEGNGMKISGMGLVQMASRQTGGMFSQIGYSNNKTGSVKNLTVSPKEVVFNNTNCVGALAGILSYGYIYDIEVDSTQFGLESITGLNFVGGVIGKAINKFEAKDLSSDANVWAVYSPTANESYHENASNENTYSYAGGLIGFVGSGIVYNAHADNINIVTGGRAGFAFGGVGSGADVKYAFVDVGVGSKLRANHYAGYVAGENAGKLTYAYVESNGNIESSFSNKPRAAVGVGGIVGRFAGGIISDVKVDQGFRATNNSDENSIGNVGGIVGVVDGGATLSILRRAQVNCDISATTNLGGAVGSVQSPLNIQETAVKSQLLSISGEVTSPCLGGIVAKITEDPIASLSIEQSYCWADLTVNSYTVGAASTASVGGLIGADSGKIVTLSYCYTTSKISAEVYDTRALGDIKEYSSENRNVKFVYDVKDNYDNVYYFGTAEEGEGYLAYPMLSRSDFVKFNTKAKSVQMGLTVTNYGAASYNYASETLQASSDAGLSKNCFNGLFGLKYLINQTDIQGEGSLIKQEHETYEGIYNPLNNWFVFKVFVTGSTGYPKEETYIFKADTNDKSLYKSENGYSISLSNMSQQLVYRNGDSYVAQNNNGGPSVWKIDFKALSVLSMEDTFGWTNLI